MPAPPRSIPHAFGLIALLTIANAAPSMALPDLTVPDPGGDAGRVNAPITVGVQAKGLSTSRPYSVRERLAGKRLGDPVPAQVHVKGTEARVTFLLPSGPAGTRKFALVAEGKPPATGLTAAIDAATGQVILRQGAAPVLEYKLKTVEPGDLLKSIAEPNLIYARPRSDYIHPLYGPHGEELTKDLPIDHPHHRGIYWAWPETMYGTEMGDLHALQRVFARSTGKVELAGGPVYAQVMAESRWMWEDKEPIVREEAEIRAYAATPAGRCIDLTFRMWALKDGVTIARRGTEAYGGLNLRFSPITDQQIIWHTDPANTQGRQAWEVIQGTFGGASAPTAVVVLQSPTNPEYPGDWVKYPELNWSQPTFPTAKTRYALKQDLPLVLQFRVWVRDGGVPADDLCSAMWKAYAAH